MADVFVSYSRRDGEFVRRLVAALGERGKEAWVDVEGIRDAEVFPERLRAAIEESDGFVFVISPDSVASEYCEVEVAHALELHKRVVPLLLRQVPDSEVPEGIRVRNWIPFGNEGGELEPSVGRVVEALDTDLEWTKAHTRWLVKALEWDAEGRERSFLLRGSELAAAEAWLAQEAGKEPEPTGLQREYAAASRVAASQRQRRLLGVAAGVVAVSLGLLVFALISRSNAIAAGKTSKSQALAAESQTQLAIDPERSILLAVAAMHQKVTPEATFALRAALDASPIRLRLPDAGVQSCGQLGFTAPGVAFGPDGKEVAEGLCGGKLVLAAARTGRVVRRLDPGAGAGGGPVAFSRDGRELAVCCRNGSAVLLDARTGAVRAVSPQPAGSVVSLAFSPSASMLALGGLDGQVILWNFTTHRSRSLFGSALNGGAPSEAVALAFSPDGSRIALGAISPGGDGLGLLVLDVRTGRVLAKGTPGMETAAVAFSPDGKTLVAAQQSVRYTGRIELLDARTLRPLRTLAEKPAVGANAVAFSPDGTRVAYGFYDGSAALVSVRTGRQLLAYSGQTAAIDQVAFSPDGRRVATASADGTTRIWSTSGGEQTLFSGGGVINDMHAFGDRVEAIVHRAGRLEVDGWSLRGSPEGAPLVLSRAGSSVSFGVISPDGRLAAAFPGNGGSARIWSLTRRRLVEGVPPSQAGGPADFNAHGTLIAAAFPAPSGAATIVGLTDLRTGTTEDLGTTPCSNGWSAVPFSHDGTLVATGAFCGRVEVWSVATGRRVGRPFVIGGELSDIAFAPDGGRIAVASWNGTVTVADARTGRILGQLTGDTSGVTSVVYSPDGRYVATASLDGTVRIWNARTLGPLRVLPQPEPVYGVRFTPDGRDVIDWDDANTIRVWDACPDCESPKALLALAATRVTRALTPQERRTFGAG
jgi:WD40 repeat protein